MSSPGCCLIPFVRGPRHRGLGQRAAGDYPEYPVLRHKPTPPGRAELDLEAGRLPFVAAVWTDSRSSVARRPMLEVYLGPSTAQCSLALASGFHRC
jgi:hypothetical protein